MPALPSLAGSGIVPVEATNNGVDFSQGGSMEGGGAMFEYIDEPAVTNLMPSIGEIRYDTIQACHELHGHTP